jgi:hypothetical protein
MGKPIEKKRKFPIRIVLMLVLILAASVFGVLYMLNSQKEDLYIENLRQVSTTMKKGAATSEIVLDLVGRIWYNAIYEESDPITDEYTKDSGWYGKEGFVEDFNEALTNYFTSDEATVKFDAIQLNQKEVRILMEELQYPPQKLEDYYDTVTELYVAYQSLTDFALNPGGSLQSFSQEKNDRIDKFSELFNKLQVQLP